MANIGDNVSGNLDSMPAQICILAEESKRQGETLKNILEKLGLLERALGDFTTMHAVQKIQMENDRHRIVQAEESIKALSTKVATLERNYEKAEASIKTFWWLVSPVAVAVGGLVLSALRDKLK